MLDFVVDVLTIAKLEAGRFTLELERVDVPEAIEATLDEFRQSEAGQGRDITLSVSGAPSPIDADRRAVEQMRLKLLSNAAKFSKAGTPIRGTGTGGDGFTSVTVGDQGRCLAPRR